MQILPDVKAAIVEWINQEVAVPQEEPEAELVGGKESSDKEEDDEELTPQVEEQTQWVTATTRYGRSSRLPERYRLEMNAAATTGIASKNYYVLLYKE